MTPTTVATAFRQGQRVTDEDGNRATFLRVVPPTVMYNWRDPGAIVRYVGDQHESICPLRYLTTGWAKKEKAT